MINFSDESRRVLLDGVYKDVVTSRELSGSVSVPVCGYLVLERAQNK